MTKANERQIWEYPVGLSRFTLLVPTGAQLLRVVSHGYNAVKLCALVAVDARLETREFRCIPTGTAIIDPAGLGKYVDSFQRNSGGETWHLFDCGPVKSGPADPAGRP